MGFRIVSKLEPATTSEVETVFQQAFEEIRGDFFGFVDTTFLETLNAVPRNMIKEVRRMVDSAFSGDGDTLVMEQDCCRGRGLEEAMIMAKERLTNGGRVIGYGVTASQDQTDRLSGRIINPEDSVLAEFPLPHGDRLFRPFTPNGFASVVERDIHQVCSSIGTRFNLIFSDNTYNFLESPWLAISDSVNHLRVGGVLVVKTIPNDNVVNQKCRQIGLAAVVDNLRELNPGYRINVAKGSIFDNVIVIQRLSEEEFKLGMYFGWVTDSYENGEVDRKNLKSVLFDEGEDYAEFELLADFCYTGPYSKLSLDSI